MSFNCSGILLRHSGMRIESQQKRRNVIALLARHVRTALREKNIPFTKVRTMNERIFVETLEATAAARAASRVFGVVSASPVAATPADIHQILEAGLIMARNTFRKTLAFTVSVRQVDINSHSSLDIREKLSEHILEGLPELRLRADSMTPDRTISVEVIYDWAYLFTETIKGVAGMPTGFQGKVVCTISSGLDSPVAAYKVMKRGCVPVFVHFDNTPFSDESNKELAIKQAKHLAEYIYDNEVKMYIVPHGNDLVEVLKHAPRKMTCIFCRRNMYRLARQVAISEDADAIVTGEIIGEQASQTSRNLRAETGAVCDVLILRPCIGTDKVEIERQAMEIGTYDFAREAVSCCILPPKHPSVYARLEDVIAAESKMDFDWVEEEFSRAEVLILRRSGGHD